jgi:hypothetical protein
MLLGTYRITTVKERLFTVQVVSSNVPASEGMKVLIYHSSTPQPPVESSPPSAEEAMDVNLPGEEVRSLFSPDYSKKVPVDVKAIQIKLDELGYYSGPLDGKMNEQTRLAIMKFQQDQSLPVDGRPSHDLLEILHAESMGFDRYLKKFN